MHCPRCRGYMIVIARNIQPNSTQTWYECTTCSGQRLLSADRLRYSDAWGKPLTSRFQAEAPAASDTRTAYRLHRQYNPIR